MNKNELMSVLNDWNCWSRQFNYGVPRTAYLERSRMLLRANQILVVTGARRSGKSFLMRQIAGQLLQNGVPARDILVVNFEDPRLPALNTEMLQAVFATYAEMMRPEGMPYVFLDEIQEVEGWEKWVRTMHELGKAKLIISGSNANLLGREFATALTGRHLDMEVQPLSFREYLSFKRATSADAGHALLREFLDYGSFPEVVLSPEKRETLMRYFMDVIDKDIVRRFGVRKEKSILELGRFYLTNATSSITFTSLGKGMEITPNTIERYSMYFEQAYLLFFLKRFSFKMGEQERSPRKVYAVDTGLANVVGFRFSENAGKCAENAVYCELRKRSLGIPERELYYWKDPQHWEVDFVVKDGPRVSRLIQVCWNIANPETKKRELRSLAKAMGELKVSAGTVITQDLAGEEEVNGHRITHQPLLDFLTA